MAQPGDISQGGTAAGGVFGMGGESGLGGVSSVGPGTGAPSSAPLNTGGRTYYGTVTGNGGLPAKSATGGASADLVVVDSFDNPAQVQQFRPATYVPTDCSINLGIANDAGTSLQVDWSGALDINADAVLPGSLKVTATFTNWNQWWQVIMNGPTDALGNPIDLTNKLVTAQIRLTQGPSPNPSYPFGAQVFIETGSSYVWGASPWTNIMATNTWIRLALDTTAPDGVPTGVTFDPSVQVLLGVMLHTGGAGESPYCAGNYGAPFGPPLTTVAYIDQIQIESRP